MLCYNIYEVKEMIKSFNKIIKLKGEKVMEKDIKNIIKKIKQEVEKISSGETF